MINFYKQDTFNPDKYKRSGWVVTLTKSEHDKGKLRLIVRVSTGRKKWPLFSVLPNFELGLKDPILKDIKFSLNYYTHPMFDRFLNELNLALSDIYQTEINLSNVPSIKKEGFHSSVNF